MGWGTAYCKNQFLVGKEEKVPLKDTYLDTSRSSTDHSHVGELLFFTNPQDVIITDLSATSPPLPTKSNGDAPLQANRVIVKEAVSILLNTFFTSFSVISVTSLLIAAFRSLSLHFN